MTPASRRYRRASSQDFAIAAAEIQAAAVVYLLDPPPHDPLTPQRRSVLHWRDKR
jgi:hypothetical protein